MRRAHIAVVVCCALLAIAACSAVQASKVVSGTLLSWSRDTLVIQNDSNNKPLTLKPEAGATIMRGQLGKSLSKARLLDFAPGDRVVAVLKANGAVSSLKGYYAVTKGSYLKSTGSKIFFQNGSSVRLRPGVQVVLAGGRMGKPADLKPGSLLLCRQNPSTKEVWTVVATEPTPKPVAVAPVVPSIKPEITSVTYSGPDPIKVRDWIRVDVEGTPGCRATCQVKGLIPVTVMEEKTPGHYRAQVMVPSGKPVKDAAMTARLTFGAAESETIQAAKLITVQPVTEQVAGITQVIPEIKPEELPQPAPETTEPPPAVAPEEPAPEPVVEAPKPEPPKPKAAVALTSPVNEARIQRTLQVMGTAEPGSSVMVTVTYNNAMGGVLNLSGQVSSQLVAVGQNGQFAIGPIALEGPLATKGLIFTVSACYPDAVDQRAMVSVFGDRS